MRLGRRKPRAASALAMALIGTTSLWAAGAATTSDETSPPPRPAESAMATLSGAFPGPLPSSPNSGPQEANAGDAAPAVEASALLPSSSSPGLLPDTRWRRDRPAGPAAPCETREGDFDLPMPWGEPSFEAYRAGYLTEGGRRWLAAMVDKGRPWMSFIMERIYAYGLPAELAWLPIIESEYSAYAVSKSGAVGMWQFMRNSIAGYGIKIDDWVDERRDFMKATDAALRKLADNYNTLGDWNLALAAYNMGLGAVSRAAAAGHTKDFFALREEGRLSRETSSYVPKFLAVASILREPARYGFTLSWDEPTEWETIEPDRSVDLGLLSSASGISLERLRSANAELRYTVTPPWKGYQLKVPEASVDSIKTALADRSRKLLRYTLHTVRSGDSVSAISRAYGAPIQLIVGANPGLQPSLIKIGQVIVIPVLRDGPPPQPPVLVDDAPPFKGSYTVTKGDSLWSLALRYGVRPEILAERNGLELTSVLREGMSLSVPITNP